jgi:hypothetical protein
MAITVPHSAAPDLQKAVHTALTSASAFTSIANGPYDPPRKTVIFPYVTYGEHFESDWYSFGNTGRQVLFMFHVWSQQLGTASFGFKEAYTILDVITQTLETQTLTMDNFTMVKNGFLFVNSSKQLDSDGIRLKLAISSRETM